MAQPEKCVKLTIAARELGVDPRTLRSYLIRICGVVPPQMGRGRSPLITRRNLEIIKARLCGRQEFAPRNFAAAVNFGGLK